MSSKQATYPKDVFTSLEELLRMESVSRHFSLRAKRQKVSSILGGKHASKLRGRGLDFEEVRLYSKGDDIRNIDWKVTARTQQTHTRVFSEEKEKPALILVDQSKSMFFGSQKRTKSVVAAELAATLAFQVLKQGDRVGGIVMADEGTDIIFPKRDRKNILRFLERIVARNHELNHSKPIDFEASLKDVMAKTRNIVTHDFLVVIISDFHRYSPEVTKYIKQLAQHNDVMLAKVFDPMERNIPNEKFIAGNAQHQVSVDGKKKQLRKKFEEGFDNDFEDFKTELKKHRIPSFSVNTIDPLEDQIKEYFKKSSK
ncbi:DUF58 domain-containing protein [Owenweeksia hongkongensis]|uniref:DUF58 domain-containing protein n=1 Tax=Owenweeksia hongkongensis TaxID=253245 RepID=UPI003A940F0F